jgi:hypothetical protein
VLGFFGFVRALCFWLSPLRGEGLVSEAGSVASASETKGEGAVSLVVFAFEGQIILSSRIPDFWGEESKTLSQKPVRFASFDECDSSFANCLWEST